MEDIIFRDEYPIDFVKTIAMEDGDVLRRALLKYLGNCLYTDSFVREQTGRT